MCGKVSGLPQAHHRQAVQVSDDAVRRRVCRRPVKHIPGVVLKQAPVVEVLRDASHVPLEKRKRFPAEVGVTGQQVMLLCPAHPEKAPGRQDIGPAAGNMAFNKRGAVQAAAGLNPAVAAQPGVAADDQVYQSFVAGVADPVDLLISRAVSIGVLRAAPDTLRPGLPDRGKHRVGAGKLALACSRISTHLDLNGRILNASVTLRNVSQV